MRITPPLPLWLSFFILFQLVLTYFLSTAPISLEFPQCLHLLIQELDHIRTFP